MYIGEILVLCLYVHIYAKLIKLLVVINKLLNLNKLVDLLIHTYTVYYKFKKIEKGVEVG